MLSVKASLDGLNSPNSWQSADLFTEKKFSCLLIGDESVRNNDTA